MLDKIMEMVGGDALSAITGNAGISMDQAKEMLPLAQDSLQEGLMSEVTGGNMEGLLGMFNSVAGGGLMNNSIFGSIKGLFIKKIMTGLGLPESIAGLAAGSGLGSIVSSLAGMMQSDGDNDGIDISNITNVLGLGGGAAGMLGGLMGAAGGAGGIVENLKDAAGDILGGGVEGASGLVDNLKDAAGGVLGSAEEGASGLVDNLKDVAGNVLSSTEGAGELVDNIKDAAGDLLSNGADGASEAIGNLAGKVTGGAEDVADGLKNVAGNVVGSGAEAGKKAGGILSSIFRMFGKK